MRRNAFVGMGLAILLLAGCETTQDAYTRSEAILNQAIAAAMVHGPAKGLAMLEPLNAEPRVRGHHRLHAVRAHLLEMAGDSQSAAEQYRLAASRTTSLPERDYLLKQASRAGTPCPCSHSSANNSV